MDLFVGMYLLPDEDEETVEVSRKELRDINNVLEMPTNQFIKHFRVSKDIFLFILQKFKQHSSPIFRTTKIRPDIKITTFLRFLATGSYQHTVGNEFVSSTSKATVCRIVKECLTFFENVICGEWIKMADPEKQYEIKQHFFNSVGFPGIIGCVDGTHIRIICPGDNFKHLYYNKKGFYSINAMMICDHKMNIMYVDARHPGAHNDAFVWEQSIADQNLKCSYQSGQKNTWILGDGGYKLKPYLMTPFKNPSNTDEKKYNKKHESSRIVVKRCFGILKNRFRCITGSRGLYYSPQKVTQIVNACCALHNMCIFYKCIEPPVIALDYEETIDDVDQEEDDDEEAISIRRNIALNMQ